MPLIVQDFSWTQTESMLYISVPLKGIKPGKVDILATNEYIKVSFPPFLFEVFLFDLIDDDKSAAKIGNGVVIFTLYKKNDRMWEQLGMKDDDKQRLKEIRERAVLKTQEKAAADSKAKAARKQEEKKYALQRMMQLEDEERARIKKIKDEEREKAIAEMEAWKLKQRQEAEKIKAQQSQIEAQQRQGEEAEHKQRKSDQIPPPRAKEKGAIVKHAKQKQVALPAPRSSGNIKIHFTPRVFPTALRESRVPEEEEWLKKQAEARRAGAGEVPELMDLKEEERNPDWLKEKGNKLFATGNYLAAVNAYNLAIQLNRKIPALYSNRAACHLKLRNLHKAIEDSSTALNLLTPAVADNAEARMKAHLRRGTAFCELELYAEGLQDYQAALKIDPHNEAVKEDAQKIRNIIQGSVDGPSDSGEGNMGHCV
ncbi:dynein assembly factor 4, axonemal [Megalops cyprinoides]|uniref:dynein assembly factor 4, axonemal n=1 Tax=Megalops cyprinoides TaxID=118141 RepID=UPI0018656606|nr:dynein assembly factor 4, axonemal [Megalops cyprinoides]